MNFKDWLTIVNEAESTAEKDDKAEKAAKKKKSQSKSES